MDFTLFFRHIQYIVVYLFSPYKRRQMQVFSARSLFIFLLIDAKSGGYSHIRNILHFIINYLIQFLVFSIPITLPKWADPPLYPSLHCGYARQ